MIKDIPVVLLCGGIGTRLREETEFIPKPMVAIGNKPIRGRGYWKSIKRSLSFPLELAQDGSIPLNSFPNIDAQELGIAVEMFQCRQLFGEFDRFRL